MYKENIQKLLFEYDVVIFMARKAICFYESMVTNGELTTTDCKVFSSRVIDYNIVNTFSNKKIAIVDDVVVKGTSLNKVVTVLNQYNINAYVLVVACEASFPATLSCNTNYEMCNTYVTLDQKDIYAFAGMITEYIEASMCPFNIDQPIYNLPVLTQQELSKFLYLYHAVNISSWLQQKNGIKSSVVYFKHVPLTKDSTIDNILRKSILKIRFMTNGERTIAIPFVLFPQITIEQLNIIYSKIQTSELDELISVGNPLVSEENKLKLVNYYFSDYLLNSFFSTINISFYKNKNNDIFQFSKPTDELYSFSLPFFTQSLDLPLFLTSHVNAFSKFNFSNVLNKCYDAITQINYQELFFDSSQRIISEPIITHEYLTVSISNDFTDAEILASCAIDVFIDKGMMVPTIVHSDSAIIRAYKMGEYSKLTRSQIESFAAMLFQYQEMIKSSLGKTEFEKLCVLFFNSAISKSVFPQQASFENDCYSICYSLFGPRVSTSNNSYNVSSDSVLITNFCEKKNGESLVVYKDGKYTISPIVATPNMRQFVTGFAYQYASVRKVFGSKEKHTTKSTSWNMYVHTYIQYLTLRAIGNNKKNQYLSLCAELYQLTRLGDDLFSPDSVNFKAYEWALKGINSGLWKHWCYRNNAFDKTTQQIFKKSPEVGAILFLDPEPVYDLKDDWDTLIDNAGILLYKAAFFINEVFKAKNKLDTINIGDDITEVSTNNNSTAKTIFTRNAYYAQFKNLRHEIERTTTEQFSTSSSTFTQWYKATLRELKAAARRQLNICDMVLEESTTKYASIKKLLVVYSPSGDFPHNISDGLNELYLEGIEKTHCCKVYGLSEQKSGVSDFANMLDRVEQSLEYSQLRYFVFDVDESISANHVDNRAKGSCLAQIINSTISKFSNGEFPSVSELIVVGKNVQNTSFEYGKRRFVLNNPITLSTASENEISELVAEIHSLGASSLNIGTFAITINIILEGDGDVNIGNVEKIHNIIEQNASGATATIVEGNVNYEQIPNGMIDKLLELQSQCDKTDKVTLDNAIAAAKNNDSNKFISAMKTLGKHTLNIAEGILGTVFYEWLHQNGIL